MCNEMLVLFQIGLDVLYPKKNFFFLHICNYAITSENVKHNPVYNNPNAHYLKLLFFLPYMYTDVYKRQVHVFRTHSFNKCLQFNFTLYSFFSLYLISNDSDKISV